MHARFEQWRLETAGPDSVRSTLQLLGAFEPSRRTVVPVMAVTVHKVVKESYWTARGTIKPITVEPDNQSRD